LPEEPPIKAAPEEPAAATEAAMDGGKGISLTPLLNAFLMPTAQYLGLQLRDRVKALIEGKKDQNIRSHITRNLRTFERYKDVSYDAETFTRFEKWIAGIEDVDFNSEELSKLWDEVLSKNIGQRPAFGHAD
jgi:hypothetical protein